MDQMVRNVIACNCIPIIRIAFRYAHISFSFFDDFNCVFTQIHCLSRVLVLQRVSNGYFKENYYFPKFKKGSNFSRGVGGVLICCGLYCQLKDLIFWSSGLWKFFTFFHVFHGLSHALSLDRVRTGLKST